MAANLLTPTNAPNRCDVAIVQTVQGNGENLIASIKALNAF
jgi:hypothetical protein